MIIVDKRGEHANFATEHLGANMERIMRSSKKPCLLTPREFQPVNRVLLAYDDSTSCEKALDYLIELPVFEDLELHIICVAKQDKLKASKYLEYAENRVKAVGLNPICQVLQGEPELEMEQYTEEQYIDLLLMGAYGHSRIRHLNYW